MTIAMKLSDAMRNHLRRSIVVQVRNKTPEKVLPNHRHTSREVTRDWSDGVLRVVPELTPKTGSRNPGGLSWPTASAVSQRLLLYPIGTCLFEYAITNGVAYGQNPSVSA